MMASFFLRAKVKNKYILIHTTFLFCDWSQVQDSSSCPWYVSFQMRTNDFQYLSILSYVLWIFLQCMSPILHLFVEQWRQENFVLTNFTAKAVFFGLSVQTRVTPPKNFTSWSLTGDYFECSIKGCGVKGSRHFRKAAWHIDIAVVCCAA